MSKALKSLIRLNEWKVDENRRILGKVLAEVAAFQTELEQKETQVLIAQGALNKSYQELKRFEILHKEIQKAKKKERDKKDQDMMDELSIQIFQRT